MKTILDAFKSSIQVEKAQEAAEKEAQKAIQKEAQRLISTPRNIEFFDPFLQFDFLELRLYHNINEFAKHILQCANQYREIDIIELLFKCLREPAFQ